MTLESLTSKGVAFDDAVAQTLTRWEITDEDSSPSGRKIDEGFTSSCLSFGRQTKPRWSGGTSSIAAQPQQTPTDAQRELDEAEFFSLPAARRISPVGTAKSIGTLRRQWLFRSARTRKS